MAETIIGKSLVIEGEIAADEDVVVQGTVKGRVTSRDVVQLEESGVMEADVEGHSVIVSGQITGNVVATERLEISSEGRLVGDVKAGRILFSEGASFRGSVDMDL